MEAFSVLLEESIRNHGHLCPGQVLGVRMSILGLQRIGIHDPKGSDRKKIYVIVEIDRCATDAIQSVTGCSLGKRSMKWLDNGIMAASFVNLETGRAVRITAVEESRGRARSYCHDIIDIKQRQLEAYKIMPDGELFEVIDVQIDIPMYDLPGKPRKKTRCISCGEYVQDGREVRTQQGVHCKNCAHGRYFLEIKREVRDGRGVQ